MTQIKLGERADECRTRMTELRQEMDDYNQLVIYIKALSMVKSNPDKWTTYSKEDFDKVVSKVTSICQKHEIRLPEYVEWEAIEII